MRRRGVIVLCATAALPLRAAVPELACSLTLARPGRLVFALRNRGRRTLQLLVWGTPFERGWFAPFVRVWRDGVELPYQGPSVKRGEPGRDEYLRWAPGQTREARFALLPAFDAGTPGRYRVEPRIVLHDVATGGRVPRPRSAHQSMPLDCAAVEFTLG